MIAAAFICARCDRHKLGSSAHPAPEGVVCGSDTCEPRRCRCRCCDEHCDKEACQFFGERG